jgi:hypothetical protein
MDVLRIYQDFGVEHYTEGHKHCSDGWVNTECPHCTGNPGVHLGWNIMENYYKCRRCGWHSPISTLSAILHITTKETYELVKSYGVLRSFVRKKSKDKKEFKFPSNASKLKDSHLAYLKGRGFSPNKIAKIWNLKGTGPISSLDDGHGKVIDYRFRIVIPFEWNGETVTFDSRDITNRQSNKYQACPITREAIEHKAIVYGHQEAWEDTGICVEGPTDVWRFGEQSFAVSGIEYKQEQVRVIANAFKKVAVCFDDESQAARSARKLIKDLQFRNVDAYQVKIQGDPGSMSQQQANKLVKNILNKK